MEAGQYLKRELTKIACRTYQGETDLAKLVAEWKTPWGIELCKKYQFPTAEFFERYADKLQAFGVFRGQKGVQFYNRDIVLVGSEAVLRYAYPEQTYTVMLYGGSKCTIEASHCAVVKICDITGDNEYFLNGSDDSTIVVK